MMHAEDVLECIERHILRHREGTCAKVLLDDVMVILAAYFEDAE